MTPHWCALVFVLSLAGPAAAQAQAPTMVPRLAFERADWNEVSLLAQRPLRTRHVATFLTSIPAGLLLVLYVYRRRSYLLAWCAAWLLLGAMLYGVAVSADLIRAGHLALGGALLGVSRALGLASVALQWIAPGFARRASWRHWRGPLLLLLAATAWLSVSTSIVGVAPTIATSYVALGVLYTAAGVAYLRAGRTQHRGGALVIGLGMLGVATSYAYALALAAESAAVEAPNATVFVSMVWHAVVALGMHFMTFEDMNAELEATNAQLARAQRDLHEAAVTDPLTGCYNRRFFGEVADDELERHRRHRLPTSILFIDCDNLKGVNDTLGHAVGDEVLQTIARIIHTHVRRSDYVFRWGGDEFVVMAACDASQALAKAREIQEAFRADGLVRRLSVFTGVSVGCCDVPSDARDLLPIIRKADARMYADKWQTV